MTGRDAFVCIPFALWGRRAPCVLVFPYQEPSPRYWQEAVFLTVTDTKIHMATQTEFHKTILLLLSLVYVVNFISFLSILINKKQFVKTL